MNFKILSNESMLATSGFLLEDEVSLAVLDGRELGLAIKNHLIYAHDLLGAMHRRRLDNEVAVSTLTEVITQLDAVHDSKARALYYYLQAFIESAADLRLAEFSHTMLRLCFPHDLEVVKRSYADEAGWARTVQIQVTVEMLDRMDATIVGVETLGDVFRAWIAAGIELGQRLGERARARSASAKRGVDAQVIHITKVRSLWIRTMRMLIDGIDMMTLSERERDALLSPISKAIASAQQLTERNGTGDSDANEDATDHDAPPSVQSPANA